MVDPNRLCIWCLKPSGTNAPPEHIYPQACGCPDTFVLRDGEVCKDCNHRLATVDKAIVNNFEAILLMMNIPRSDGKARRLVSYSNMDASMRPGEEPKIRIDVKHTHAEVPPGTVLTKNAPGKRSIKLWVEKMHGDMPEFKLQTEFRHDKKFSRGLHKIALEIVALTAGREFACDSQFNEVRSFALKGDGNRYSLLSGVKGPLATEDWEQVISSIEAPPPSVTANGELVVWFRLGPVRFLVDLSPGQTMLPIFVKAALAQYGPDGWGYAPLDGKLPGLGGVSTTA